MAVSKITITHGNETTAHLEELLKEASGDRNRGLQKLVNFFMSLGAGVRSATVDVQAAEGDAVAASGTVTLDGVQTADTVTIAGVTLTADTDFTVGVDDNTDSEELADAINDDEFLSDFVVAEAVEGAAEVTSVECVEDDSDSLDGTYFILQDNAGSVAFWIDTDDSGTSAPSHGADRAVEITTITTDDDDETVAGKVATAVDNDSQFSAAADGATVTVTDADIGARGDADAGDSGFTVDQVTEGTEPSVVITCLEKGALGNAITLASSNGTRLAVSGTHLEDGAEATANELKFGT